MVEDLGNKKIKIFRRFFGWFIKVLVAIGITIKSVDRVACVRYICKVRSVLEGLYTCVFLFDVVIN